MRILATKAVGFQRERSRRLTVNETGALWCRSVSIAEIGPWFPVTEDEEEGEDADEGVAEGEQADADCSGAQEGQGDEKLAPQCRDRRPSRPISSGEDLGSVPRPRVPGTRQKRR